ncbi:MULTISPECIES: hypothetical protein [Bradyrhizobium]|uniref:Uncharacterized protein n=1 Tax=Bradyrhizobium barranii subsp. barranii TaxID=2823807 RepID=A0A7Z0TQI7_9BRAD|nr:MULTISPECIES: hypothetical protein [Bradyrhizobium]MBR0999313.1 hypothetical protein [Bradyrhizobium liaoningense]MCP1747056.1 hypothetical protein [Bradyrhizobium japonicum]MCP1865686.1 hypothetical protein [Bradyrhizobium japonicum]MCP1895543.1 hypothetical protein [Bradyrhizobium japonicum]MCW2328926.1 hypothetical protein [Bradyrhizobium japonicum]
MAKAAKTTKAGATESAKPTESKRTDGRKALLVYMQTDLIQAAKDAASDNEENVFQFVERTVAKALGWKKPKGSKRWVP